MLNAKDRKKKNLVIQKRMKRKKGFCDFAVSQWPLADECCCMECLIGWREHTDSAVCSHCCNTVRKTTPNCRHAGRLD